MTSDDLLIASFIRFASSWGCAASCCRASKRSSRARQVSRPRIAATDCDGLRLTDELLSLQALLEGSSVSLAQLALEMLSAMAIPLHKYAAAGASESTACSPVACRLGRHPLGVERRAMSPGGCWRRTRGPAS